MGRIPQRRFCGKKEAASSIIRAGSECRHATGHGISRRYGNIKPRQLSWENPSHLPLGSFSRLGTGADRIGRGSFTRLVLVHATDTRSPARFSARIPLSTDTRKTAAARSRANLENRISTSKCLQAFHFLPFLHGLLRFLLNLGRSRSRFSRKFSCSPSSKNCSVPRVFFQGALDASPSSETPFDCDVPCATEWSQGKSFHVIREA